jgi:hypothetical protein
MKLEQQNSSNAASKQFLPRRWQLLLQLLVEGLAAMPGALISHKNQDITASALRGWFVTATNHEYLRIRACLFFIHPHSFVNNFYTCFNLNRVEKCLSVYSLDEFKNIQDTKTCFGYFGYFGYFGWLTFQIFQPAVLPKFPSDQSFARPFERLRSVEANS